MRPRRLTWWWFRRRAKQLQLFSRPEISSRESSRTTIQERLRLLAQLPHLLGKGHRLSQDRDWRDRRLRAALWLRCAASRLRQRCVEAWNQVVETPFTQERGEEEVGVGPSVAPSFLVSPEPRTRALWEAVQVLRTIKLPRPPVESPPRFRRLLSQPSRALLTSGLVHVSVVLFLFRVPLSLLFSPGAAAMEPTQIVYQLHRLPLSAYLPNLQAPGPGGRPGRGLHPDRPPARGSTAFDPRLSLVSIPLRADNRRQLILQSSSPPELRIPVELELPNLVLQNPLPRVRAPVDFRLDVRLQGQSKTRERAASPSEAPPEPSELALTPTPYQNPFPRLAVASSPSAPLEPLPQRGATAGEAGSLLILGVDPAPFTGQVSLPPGNRYGAFSVSPVFGREGSPGGVPGGDLHGGTGGPGSGGDGSTGVGPGGRGGGSPGVGTGGMVSIAGGGAGSGVGNLRESESGILSASVPANLVYPVPFKANPRRPALFVTTGPIGGGGLRVYGVLQGGKIYTIYLVMPGKNWILQYCYRDPEPTPQRRTPARVAHLDHGLVPPYVEKKFDFHRVPVPEDKADELIILRGVIEEDGSVSELKVLQGVVEMANQAALAAFGRWKFQPALRAGKPVALDILVGIPATVPESAKKQRATTAGGS